MERLLLSLVFVCSFALPIVAQERVIEEIIVTTTKKEASTQDLPISVEALSSEALEERQIVDVQSLSQQVPGLIHSKALGSGASINIRGSGPPGVGASVVDSVVSAINGHSVTNSIISDVGFLDLDIYGPSLPITFGINENPEIKDGKKIVPLEKNGIKLMSFGFISGNQAPVIWRGPLVAKMTEQFFRDVEWGELDYLILDLPPGTGDVQLTLSQKIPMDGAIIITTPNDISLADVRKGADMFNKVGTRLLGVVENMSYMKIYGQIINANKKQNITINDHLVNANEDGTFELNYSLFKKGGGQSESERLGVSMLAQIPYSQDLMLSIDQGTPIVFSDNNSDIVKSFKSLAQKILDHANS